jgi:hypothetical protein
MVLETISTEIYMNINDNLVCHTYRQRKLLFSTHLNISGKSVGIFMIYLSTNFIFLDIIEEHVCKFLFPLIWYVN